MADDRTKLLLTINKTARAIILRDWSKSIGGGWAGAERGVGHEVLSLVQGVGRAIFSYPQGVGHPIFY